LHRRFSLPWVCLGDFNEILFAEEKQGWLDQPERQMQGFRDALDDCRLKDLGFNDFPFTWCNRRLGDQNVLVRLDRGVASIDWILRFSATRIHHLEAFLSDHKPFSQTTTIFPSLGVTVDWVTKMSGFDWIEVWLQLTGFSASRLPEFIILKPFSQTTSRSYLARIRNLRAFIERVDHFALSPCG